MPRQKPTRTANGQSSVYQDQDGYWHGRVTVGIRDDGRPDRRHAGASTEAEVIRKVRRLERLRDAGRTPRRGQRWTVTRWLEHWLDNIVRPSVRENTYSGYRVDIRVHLIPGIGAHRLERLAPEHLEKLYSAMLRRGSAPATVHHVHRTVRNALGEAERRGHLARNPAALAKPPRVEEHEVEPFTVEEIQQLFKCAGDRRNSARWVLALALGLRQGETLGLKWADVDLERAILRTRRGRQRPRWKHGCSSPCGHRHGGHCPDRIPLREETADTKSRAGRRTIGLPEPLVELLRVHHQQQDTERSAAGDLWCGGDWVFASETGEVLNPRTDYTRWKGLLRDAGIRDARLHDARHTAATVLLLLGVPDRAVMDLMGWSKSDMAARYQHLTAPIRRDVASRLGALLWDR